MTCLRFASVFCLLIFLALKLDAVPISAAEPRGEPLNKIAFDLGQLNEQGLYGPPGGLRALAYEFCLPADPALAAQVKAIDPTLAVFPGSRGRIGCAHKEYLCIGNTHQPDFKAVLMKLASLPYVKQIRQCFYE